MQTLKHKNIVNLHAILDPFCLVLEYMNKGDLYQFVHSKEVKGWEREGKGHFFFTHTTIHTNTGPRKSLQFLLDNESWVGS